MGIGDFLIWSSFVSLFLASKLESCARTALLRAVSCASQLTRLQSYPGWLTSRSIACAVSGLISFIPSSCWTTLIPTVIVGDQSWCSEK